MGSRILIMVVMGSILNLLAACATTDDPAEGGYVNGIVNLTTGRYQDRIDQRQDTLAVENRAAEELANRARALRQERARVGAELDQASAQLAQLRASISQLHSRLQSEKRHLTAERAQLRAIESEIVSLEEELKQAKRGDVSIEEQSDQVTKAESRIEQLSELVETITGEGI